MHEEQPFPFHDFSLQPSKITTSSNFTTFGKSASLTAVIAPKTMQSWRIFERNKTVKAKKEKNYNGPA